MRKKTKNVVVGMLMIGLVVVTTVLTQLFFFGSQEKNPKLTEAAQSAREEVRAWNADTIYVKGERALFESKIYEAKWWTKGERPDASGEWDVWKVVAAQNADKRLPDKARGEEFRVVGYYPSWQPDKINQIRYDALTHINYAFAIPKEDGALRPLENPQVVSAIIDKAHTYGVKVLLAVGGWSYQSVPLEDTFKAATATADKSKLFAENIIAMAKDYGFDGVDIDWEYPRNGEDSARQYAELMRYLSERLKQENMLLTVAVMPGKTVDGAVQAHAAVHTNEVIADVDWINVMAYDGSDGSRHSTYDYAIDCAQYWQDIRKIPSNKIVLGVPFYGKPLSIAYHDILAVDQDAMHKDIAIMKGNLVYYNGGATIRQKTDWALENIGGIMIWELSQDSADEANSLLCVIAAAVKERGERSVAK